MVKIKPCEIYSVVLYNMTKVNYKSKTFKSITNFISSMLFHRKIFSFDLDARRLATMGTMTLKAGVLCAELINQDFLKVNLSDPKFAKVTHAIVDPSCSGSGMTSVLSSLFSSLFFSRVVVLCVIGPTSLALSKISFLNEERKK